MNPVSNGLLKGLRRVLEQQRKSFDICRQSRVWSSTVSFSDLDEKEDMEYDNEHTDSKRELEPQGVDPKKGWGFRGVHRAVICGKVGQVPLQKILRSGRTITSFTVGTGGMFDQRVVGPDDLPKPAQWHRIVVHNDHLGAYAIQKLVKNAAVYVEGDIETRVYNDSIDDQVRSIPEICVRRDGKIRLLKLGDSAAGISLDELIDIVRSLKHLKFSDSFVTVLQKVELQLETLKYRTLNFGNRETISSLKEGNQPSNPRSSTSWKKLPFSLQAHRMQPDKQRLFI